MIRRADPSAAMVGYCTNVHPGISLADVKRNLALETLNVKRQVVGDQPMAVGLWLSETATRELASEKQQRLFGDWLAERDLIPATINAFPFGDFHQPVVKRAVYQPTWADANRLEYTSRVATIQDRLLPADFRATISTLPLGWPESNSEPTTDEFYQQCARHLHQLAKHLESIRQTTGRHIRVCLEPEPGCVLDTCDDIVRFFERYLLVNEGAPADRVREYLGVCHDVCHSAVMFEPQAIALDTYAGHGITVGKVQVSSAIEANFDSVDRTRANQLLAELANFSEPRYLHQTSIRRGDRVELFEDLPLAIAANRDSIGGVWRVHFHVPIFAAKLGAIGSTQGEIIACLDWFKADEQTAPHFEVETYAWNVLPAGMKPPSLVAGIAKELLWLGEQTV